MTSQQDTDFVKCIQGHCMHPEDPEVCWYERNWREICQTETDHDVINDILSARQDQALTSWKDKEVRSAELKARLVELDLLEQSINRWHDNKMMSETYIAYLDEFKMKRLKDLTDRLEPLQSQGGKS